MPGHYVISKHDEGWAITVDGALLLICERKKMAIRAVREAMRNASTADTRGQGCEPVSEPQSGYCTELLIAIAS